MLGNNNHKGGLMLKLHVFFLILTGWILASCTTETAVVNQSELSQIVSQAETGKKPSEISEEVRKVIQNRCINRQFRQGDAENLYGRECIEGKQILIQSSKTGKEVPTFTVTSSNKDLGIELEGDLDFTNKFHKLSYTISKDKGSDKTIPWLRDLLPENIDFLGRPDTSYSIVFKIQGDYLVLFKSSEKQNHLPYTERTSMSKEGDLYMVPFIGYPIQYCHPRLQKDEDGEEKWLSESNCGTNQPAESAEYISFSKDNRQFYKYLPKNNLFPSNYFEGRWIFAQSPIETPNMQEVSPFTAFIVDMEKMSSQLNIRNVSGDIDENRQKILRQIPVEWLSFEMDRDGDSWGQFGERKTKHSTVSDIEKPYLRIKFENMQGLSPGESIENYIVVPGQKADIVKIKLSQDGFSYVFEQAIQGPCKRNTTGQPVCESDEKVDAKIRYSFLREKALDQEGFVPRRWFRDEHDHIFGVIPAFPQKDFKMGETSEIDRLDHARMMRFNLSLNSPEEKSSRTKEIVWHFSKNSTKDSEYRELFRQAVATYDRAFEIIMEGSGKKVRVLLDETEERDLGDLQANVLNAVHTGIVSNTGLIGMAPSYIHPETGQTIGTTVNVYIQNIEQIYINKVKDYIRYEIFQADKKGGVSPVSPYLIGKIQEQCEQCSPCPEVDAFIRQKKRSGAEPRDYLDDKEITVSCGKKIAREYILANIIHEMGHSFALGHNFKGSVDKDNYYQSIDELKEYFPTAQAKNVTKLSSAMDYSPSDAPEITVLGKYDLAALRFIYRDQVETKDGTWTSLSIDPLDPAKHQMIDENLISNMKSYQHCSDFVAQKERQQDFLCVWHDYGSNPEEIVNGYVEKVKRIFSKRYRYDLDNFDFLKRNQTVPLMVDFYVRHILNFYSQWLSYRNKYLQATNNLDKVKFVLNSEEALEQYHSVLQEGLEQKQDTEYALYYPIREIVPPFIMDFLFASSMKCKVQQGEQVWTLNLESIRKYLVDEHHENLYVEDCYSPMITDFFNKNGLTLNEQTGLNIFNSYYSEGTNASLKDVVSWSHLFSRVHRQFSSMRPIYWNALNVFVAEPDFFSLFRDKLEQEIKNEGHSEFDVAKRFTLFTDYYQSLKKTLPQNQYHSLYQSHFDDSSHVKFSLGTGEQSFYKRFLEPFQNGMPVKDMGIPFLSMTFNNYNNLGSTHLFNFQTYLRQRDDTIDPHTHSMGAKGQSANYFIIPKMPNSLAADIIKEYNAQAKELKRLRALEQTRELSPLEKILKSEIKINSESLMMLAQIIEFRH